MNEPNASGWRRPNAAPASGQSRETAQFSAAPPWLRELVHWMDSAFRVPGTEFRIGLDPILGLLLPGVGDFLSSLPSLLLLSLAVRQGVPPVIVLRMLLNVAFDSLVGAVPLLGDLFDAAYRSNEKNLALLEAHSHPDRRPAAGDYLVVGFVLAVLLAVAILPILLVALLVKALVE